MSKKRISTEDVIQELNDIINNPSPVELELEEDDYDRAEREERERREAIRMERNQEAIEARKKAFAAAAAQQQTSNIGGKSVNKSLDLSALMDPNQVVQNRMHQAVLPDSDEDEDEDDVPTEELSYFLVSQDTGAKEDCSIFYCTMVRASTHTEALEKYCKVHHAHELSQGETVDEIVEEEYLTTAEIDPSDIIY